MRKWGKPKHTNPLINLQGYFSERISYMLPMLIWPIIFAGLTILQPDMGTTVLNFWLFICAHLFSGF